MCWFAIEGYIAAGMAAVLTNTGKETGKPRCTAVCAVGRNGKLGGRRTRGKISRKVSGFDIAFATCGKGAGK